MAAPHFDGSLALTGSAFHLELPMPKTLRSMRSAPWDSSAVTTELAMVGQSDTQRFAAMVLQHGTSTCVFQMRGLQCAAGRCGPVAREVRPRFLRLDRMRRKAPTQSTCTFNTVSKRGFASGLGAL
jgi:hypothetical protein